MAAMTAAATLQNKELNVTGEPRPSSQSVSPSNSIAKKTPFSTPSLPHPTTLINEKSRRAHVSASREQWEYGHWECKPACLMVLEFRFHPGFRFPSAEVQVTFDALDGTPNCVTVEAFGPSMLHGTETKDTVTSEFTFSPTLTLTGGPAVASAGLSSQHGQNYDRIERAFVEGDASPWVGNATKNHLQWCLQQDNDQKAGIPRRLRCAVVVSYTRHFQMKCSAEITGGFWQLWRMTGSPLKWWRKPMVLEKPLVFREHDKGIPVLATGWRRSKGGTASRGIGTDIQDNSNAPPNAPQTVDRLRDESAKPVEALPSNLGHDFGLITLGEWQRIIQPEWTNTPTTKPDPSSTIYGILHDLDSSPNDVQSSTGDGASPSDTAGSLKPPDVLIQDYQKAEG